MVTVVLTSYNHLPYLPIALQSALAQDVDLEVVVVDDASTDGSADYLRTITDPRVKVVCLNQNRAVQPRNAALEVASGSHVAFLCSDDAWKSGKLRRQLDLIEDRPACFTGVEMMDAAGAPKPDSIFTALFAKSNRTQTAWLRSFLETGNSLCISSALVRRDALQRGFNGSMVQLSDLEMWIRLAATGPFAFDTESTTLMRDTGENISTPTPAAVNRGVVEYIDCIRLFATPQLSRLLHEVIPERIAPHHCHASRVALLADHLWSLGPPHRLAADHVVAELMASADARAQAVEQLGTEWIHRFIERRGTVQYAPQ